MHLSWSYGKKLKFVEIVMIPASHLAPTIHIIVVILSKYLQRAQFDEKKNIIYVGNVYN